MNSVERITKALHLQPVDRVPVIPEMIQSVIELAGVTHKAFSTDGAVMAHTVLAGQKFYGYDAVYVSTDNYVLAEAFGANLRFPADAPPQLPTHPLQSINPMELAPFSIENGRIPVILRATTLCREALGDTVFVKTNIDSSPFSAAACLCGSEPLMMALFDTPEKVHDLLKVCTEAIITYGKAAAKAGAHGIAFGDSVAGLLGRDLYVEFALPYAQKAVAELHKTGLPVFYHVCGNTRHIADLMIQTGADCIEIDSMMPMDEMQKLAHDKCCVEGNISTIESILNGTPEDVYREANAILDLFGNRGGLILSSACEVPRFSPPENIRAITDAALRYLSSRGDTM
ncbi:MAG: uroporphyrinogen decarboxylase family protein [Ruthenibacterium sp.]